MNGTFTGIIAVVILVLLVGFGVWYFTVREGVEEPRDGIRIEVGGEGNENGS